MLQLKSHLMFQYLTFLLQLFTISTSVPCEYPLISTVFYTEGFKRNRAPPELMFVNSSAHLNISQDFPFQFLLLNCSAPYPIKWDTDLPKDYFFSYILDDELRTTSPTSNGTREEFSIRLHIGNETLSRRDFSGLQIGCQPVDDSERGCGKTTMSVDKQLNESLNKTMLRVSFDMQSFSIQNISSPNYSLLVDNCISGTEPVANTKIQLAAGNCSTKEIIQLPQIFQFADLKRPCTNENLVDTRLELNETSLPRPFGLLRCSNNEHFNDSILYIHTLPKMCSKADTSLSNVYYRHNIPNENPTVESDFISLCVQNASTNGIYVGDNITVTCLASIFFFAHGMTIQLSKVTTNKTENGIAQSTEERAVGLGGYRNLTATFNITSKDPLEIVCSAPKRQSKEWIRKSEKFQPKMRVQLKFKKTPNTPLSDAHGRKFFSCNATGDPIPVLVWSRLNNEILLVNESVGLGHESVTNSTWVYSKLFLPLNLDSADYNNSEFFGRYICTAQNRFEAIERVFLYDDSNTQDKAYNEIVGGFGKTVWFWITLALITVPPLIIAGVCIGWKLSHHKTRAELFSTMEIEEFLYGNPEMLLDDSYENMNTYAAYLPYDRETFEISRDQIEYDPEDILGSGEFGTVYKGVFKSGNGHTTTVAIKTVDPASDKIYFAMLLSEIKIMCFIGTHSNILGLVGACTMHLHERELYVTIEYCSNGDLLCYLKNHRATFINNAGPNFSSETNIEKSLGNGYCMLTDSRTLLSPHLLILWALQIAQGMSYLSLKKVIHGDLAARNVLLDGDLRPKIADFGLSKQLQNYANYVRKTDDRVPWRWLAVESLQSMKFSVQSDVWSFGIVLYELFSLGQVPFVNHKLYSELFFVALCQGERPEQPFLANCKVYNLMLDCWRHQPQERPSFVRLENELTIMSVDSDRQTFMTEVSSDEQRKDNLCMNKATYVNDIIDTTSWKKNPPQERASSEEKSYKLESVNDDRHALRRELQPKTAIKTQLAQLQLESYVDWNSVY